MLVGVLLLRELHEMVRKVIANTAASGECKGWEKRSVHPQYFTHLIGSLVNNA